jgi:ATP-dependent DNA helicase RecG
MRKRELLQLVRRGEDSTRQFKANVTNPDSRAAELVAFSNSQGGTMLIGVADDGALVGLSPGDVQRINQMIGNVATQTHPQPHLSPHRKRLVGRPAGGDRRDRPAGIGQTVL